MGVDLSKCSWATPTGRSQRLAAEDGAAPECSWATPTGRSQPVWQAHDGPLECSWATPTGRSQLGLGRITEQSKCSWATPTGRSQHRSASKRKRAKCSWATPTGRSQPFPTPIGASAKCSWATPTGGCQDPGGAHLRRCFGLVRHGFGVRLPLRRGHTNRRSIPGSGRTCDWVVMPPIVGQESGIPENAAKTPSPLGRGGPGRSSGRTGAEALSGGLLRPGGVGRGEDDEY